MKARFLLVTILLGLLTGCTDTADSLAREYRNQINEGLDAMMLVTDNHTAQRMTVRVFKPMDARFKEIDRRLEIVKSNRTTKGFVVEFCESDSVAMYVAEVFANRKRFSQEMSRLKTLTKKTIEQEKEAHEKSGSQDPWDPSKACPDLQKVANEASTLSALEEQLNKTPKIFGFLDGFKTAKLEGIEGILKDHQRRVEKFDSQKLVTFPLK
jgi:hypothetical protein